MNKTILTLVLCLIISQISLGQNEKVFYDLDWKVCKKDKAEYYRPFKLNEKEKLKGIIKSFYITGEKYSEGYYNYLSRTDAEYDIRDGFFKKYYKNGNKKASVSFVIGKREGLQKTWHMSGELETESYFKNGLSNGLHTSYYKNGNIKIRSEYKNDKLVSKFIISCNEFYNCEKVFNNFLYTDKYNNKEEWKIIDNKYSVSKLILNEGLYIETFELGIGKWYEVINIPLDLKNNFSINTTIECKSIDNSNNYGIIWGYNNYNNYNYFYINSNGNFKIGSVIKGIDLTEKNISTNNINKYCSLNELKILRISDELFYAINGEIVFKTEFHAFNYNNIGFAQGSNQSLIYRHFEVRQDVNEISITKNDSDNNPEIWKGNGTGFFIDKNGYIATNYHVVQEAREIEIEFVKNGVKQSFPAEIIQSDKQNDISIIKINSPKFKPFFNLPYNFKTKISDVGGNVFALGYPLALSVMGTEIKFTDGKISSKTGFKGDITSYQISVPIQPGNSGGPLFDFDGNLIGITSSTFNRKLNITENVNYAIKSSYLKSLIDVLNYNLTLPNDDSISYLTLTEKIKKLSDYVVLIKIK
jgi:S1-C subfamily serine protease